MTQRVSPDPFLPSGATGAALAARLSERLAGSFAHLREACAPHVALDHGAIGAQIGRIAAASRLRPDLFALHQDILRAAQRGDRGAIAAGFAELCASPVAAAPGLALRGWGGAGFSPGEAARFLRIFGEEDDTRVVFGPPPPAMLIAARAALMEATGVLADAAPTLHAEIQAVVSEIILAANAAQEGMSFDGVTAFHAQGALLLNAAELRSPPAALATLVHEAAHALLFAATEGAPLAENGPEERFPSPLRPDPRPMNGLCHACFVSARMVHALDCAGEVFAPEDQAEARRLRDGAWRAHAAAWTVIRANARLTPPGATLLDAAARHMALARPG